MPRLPIPGQDDGIWGEVLNEFLLVSHDQQGVLLRNDDIDNAISVATAKYTKPSGGIPKSDLSSSVQASLDNADAAAAGTVPDASSIAKGKLKLAGDLGGTADSPTVPGLASKADTSAVLLKSNNLSDLNNFMTARYNLGLAIGSDVQPWDADLDTWATKTAPAGTVVGTTDSQTLTNKTLTSPVINTPTGITKSDVGLANVSNTSDASKPISTAAQTALDAKADLTAGKVPLTQLGSGTATSSNYLRGDGTWTAVPTAPVTSVAGKTGVVTLDHTDITDLGTAATKDVAATGNASASEVVKGDDTRLTNTRTPTDGTVTDAKITASGLTDAALSASADIAQSKVHNLTSDLAAKEPTLTAGITSQYYRGDKSWQTLDKTAVGLGNVNNTSDANKPISTATQAALDLKTDITNTFVKTSNLSDLPDASAARTNLGLVIGTNVQAHDADLDTWATKTAPAGTVVGTTDSQTLTNKTLTSPAISTPTGIVKGDVGLGNVDNTSDAVKNSASVTLTNKALSDTTTTIVNVTDSSKVAKFDLSGATASKTATIAVPVTNNRTITLPDATDTLVGKATTDILTNKTLTSPVISSISNTGTLTLPTSSDTLVGRATTDTLTNKRITKRISSNTSSTTPTPNADTDDVYLLTALAAAAAFGAPTGTPTDGQSLIIRIKDNGTARALSWNAIYRIIGTTLPTTTVLSKTLYLGFMYNSADSKWDCLAVSQEA